MGWQLIQSQSLSASAASVTFSSIPQTYKSLKVVISARTSGTNVDAAIKVNNVTTGYTHRWIYGNGASALSSNSTLQERGWYVDKSADTANTFGSTEVTFPNYSATVTHPYSTDTVMENNGSTAFSGFFASLCSDTAAITSVSFGTTDSSNFVFGSTFTLYGLA